MMANQYLPHVLRGLASLPERATQAAGSLQYGGSYDPGPALEAALLMGGAPRGALGAGPIRAYHSSPHAFERFDISKIGTGEGAQAYGHGLYFAENPATAQAYREAFNARMGRQVGPDDLARRMLEYHKGNREGAIAELQRRQESSELAREIERVRGDQVSPVESNIPEAIKLLESGKHLGAYTYEVNIRADPEQLLRRDVPLSEQPYVSKVFDPQIEALKRISEIKQSHDPRGEELHNLLWGKQLMAGAPTGEASRRVSSFMRESGVPGMSYYDQFSRLRPEGRPTSNYVMFGDDLIDILRRYGVVGAIPPGLAGLVSGEGRQ